MLWTWENIGHCKGKKKYYVKETSKVISKKVRDKVEKRYIHNGRIGYYKICDKKRNR